MATIVPHPGSGGRDRPGGTPPLGRRQPDGAPAVDDLASVVAGGEAPVVDPPPPPPPPPEPLPVVAAELTLWVGVGLWVGWGDDTDTVGVGDELGVDDVGGGVGVMGGADVVGVDEVGGADVVVDGGADVVGALVDGDGLTVWPTYLGGGNWATGLPFMASSMKAFQICAGNVPP